MESPAPSGWDGEPPLYGEGSRGINRRVLLGVMLAAWPAAALAKRFPKVRAIAWEGAAHASVEGRELDLGSRTRIDLDPMTVRSTSWIVAEGEASARTMVLTPDDARVEIGGTSRPLSNQLAIHERQQFAIYLLLLGVQARRPKPGTIVNLLEPPLPPISFAIGPDGFPTAADLTVEAPAPDKPPIVEHLDFSGRLTSNGVAWPQRIAIAQNGEPYFTLSITRFEAILA